MLMTVLSGGQDLPLLEFTRAYGHVASTSAGLGQGMSHLMDFLNFKSPPAQWESLVGGYMIT